MSKAEDSYSATASPNIPDRFVRIVGSGRSSLTWRNRGPIALSSVAKFIAEQYTWKRRKGGRKKRFTVVALLANKQRITLVSMHEQAQSETEFIAHELNSYI